MLAAFLCCRQISDPKIQNGIALLYAPKSGHETREKVSDLTSNAFSKMKDFGQEAQEKLSRKVEQGREYAEEKASQFSSSSNAEEDKSYHQISR